MQLILVITGRILVIGGAGNETRGYGLVVQSLGNDNTINFVTIATAGNATDFGDQTQEKPKVVCLASSTREVYLVVVRSASISSNTIEFITIATTGDATDFGDLSRTTHLWWFLVQQEDYCMGGIYTQPSGTRTS